MTVSVVLRLVEGTLAAGKLVGFLEVVATGERVAVRGGDELLEALRSLRPAVQYGEGDQDDA
jgi:hypothetical protein